MLSDYMFPLLFYFYFILFYYFTFCLSVCNILEITMIFYPVLFYLIFLTF